MNTATFPERLRDAMQRAWRSVLLNMTLLVLSVLASAVTVIILGFFINLFIQGYSIRNDPSGLGGLAVFFSLVGYYFVGIPAMLICTLLWLAYRASSAARARAHARPHRQLTPPL